MIEESKIKEFLEDLSSTKPTPGGGAASAIVGSIAAALVCKVSALTIGKKKYQDVQEKASEILSEAKTLREDLLENAEKDSQAFNMIIEAYRSSKNMGDEEKLRVIENASKQACAVPLETASLSYRVLELSETVIKIGNRNATSDAVSAAYFAFSAINGALENVYVNLKNIKFDREFAESTLKKADEIKDSSKELYDRIRKRVDGGKNGAKTDL
ncbi:MAG: cyclodeaminase/cyclohydrolase family protein [TACK group archaeon]|nr:cyclodeaminase/cyclohydrolase family protein [TACK group archaeon]